MEINKEKDFRLAKNYVYVPVYVFDKKNIASKSFVSEEITLALEAARPIKTRIASIAICLITMPSAI